MDVQVTEARVVGQRDSDGRRLALVLGALLDHLADGRDVQAVGGEGDLDGLDRKSHV